MAARWWSSGTGSAEDRTAGRTSAALTAICVNFWLEAAMGGRRDDGRKAGDNAERVPT